MATLREQILARIAAALLNATPAGANVFRSREVSITKGLSPAIVVMPGNESHQSFGVSASKHELHVDISIFVRGDPWDQLADAVIEPAHRVVMSDAGLRSLVLDVRHVDVQSSFVSEEADRTAGTLTEPYLITYVTKPNDLSAQP